MTRRLYCRHCGKPVEAFPGKPGYADECEECFGERNPRQPPSEKPKYYKPAVNPSHERDRKLDTLERKMNLLRARQGKPPIKCGGLSKE